MAGSAYDVWYDPNEVDSHNRVQVLLAWVRAGLSLTLGAIVLAGDEDEPPVKARVIARDGDTGIAQLELLLLRSEDLGTTVA